MKLNNEVFYQKRLADLQANLKGKRVKGQSEPIRYRSYNEVLLFIKPKDKSPVFDGLLYKVVDVQHRHGKEYILYVNLCKESVDYTLLVGSRPCRLAVKYNDDLFSYQKEYYDWTSFEKSIFFDFFSTEEIKNAKRIFLEKKEQEELDCSKRKAMAKDFETQKQSLMGSAEIAEMKNLYYNVSLKFTEDYGTGKLISHLELKFPKAERYPELKATKFKVSALRAKNIFSFVGDHKFNYIEKDVAEFLTENNMPLGYATLVNSVFRQNNLNALPFIVHQYKVKTIRDLITPLTNNVKKSHKIAKAIVSGRIKTQQDLNDYCLRLRINVKILLHKITN